MKYLFKFILALFLFSTTLYSNIDECKTDIYFGNGVWNKVFTNDCEEDSAANCSQDVLNDLVQSEIIKNDPKLQAKYGEVKLQYNWGQGTMTDILETFYQLKEAGQVDDLDFFYTVYILTGGNLSLTLSTGAYKALMEPLNRNYEEGNAYEMWEKYYHESFKLSHKVLLVSHSQGNLFANRVYEKITPTKYQAYFANLQVASPASEIKAQKGDYVTGFIDPIINPIPGSMTSNADLDFPGGHKFVEAYLSSSDTLVKIITKTKQLLAGLDTESSQWELDQELNKGTKDFKITLKHRFDTAITSMQNVEVYPFKASEKLYHVKDNTPDGNGWVKASCGGEEVFNSWPTQKDGEEYLINNPEKEIIISKVIPKIIGIKFNINRAGTQNHTGRVPVMIPSYISDLDKLLSSSYGNSPDSTLAVVYTVSYHTWVGAHGLILHDIFNPTFTGSYYKLKEHNFNTSYRVMTFRTYSKEYMDKYPLYFYINNESISIHSNFLDKYNFDFNNVGTFMVGSLIDDYSYYQSYINASYNFKDIDLKI